MPTPAQPIVEHVYVVEKDVPFLFGLDLLDKGGIQFLNVTNEAECVPSTWKLPVERHHCHACLQWTLIYSAFYTRKQLERLHLHLMHQSTMNLYYVLSKQTEITYPHT